MTVLVSRFEVLDMFIFHERIGFFTRSSVAGRRSAVGAALVIGAAAMFGGCSGDESSEVVIAEAEQALDDDGLFVASAGQLWQRGAIGPNTGNAWTSAGVASNVVGMASHDGKLYMVANNALWQRGYLGPGTGDDWTRVGDAFAVTAMASFNGGLYVTSNNALWKRGAIGPGTGNDWSYAGDAFGVTAMAAFNGSLYVTSNNALWKRGAIGPNTGNDWSYAGDAFGVTAMAAFNGGLYVTSNNALWKRGAIGPNTGNAWTNSGEAWHVTAMTDAPACAPPQIRTTAGECVNPDAPDPLAVKFAPRLRFDAAAPDYPMSAQTFYEQAVAVPQSARISNADYGVVAGGQVPTYYQMIRCGNQTRLKYWWFYGYQSACDAFGNGEHNGDWEAVMVTLSEDQRSAAAVTYWAHGDHYTRIVANGGVPMDEQTHPVVYVGRHAHASYYDQSASGIYPCMFWADERRNTSGTHLDSWLRLRSLDANAEPWMVRDRQGGFFWGTDGVSTHPTVEGPSCSMSSWEGGTPVGGGPKDGTECKLGGARYDDLCFKACPAGCSRYDGSSICGCPGGSVQVGNYPLGYTLPTNDVGLMTPDY